MLDAAHRLVSESESQPVRQQAKPTRKSGRRRWWLVLVVVALAVGAYYWTSRQSDKTQYTTAEVTRGPILRSVTATGTVNPVTTVQVGTYVSGPIIAIPVDFNSRVKAGSLMAKIDPRPFAAQVALSKAALANAQAQLRKDQANLAYQKITYQRDGILRRENAISQDQLDNQLSVYNQAVAQIGLDQAAIQQQKASLDAAQLNLNYTNIIAPVDGTVVSRNVDVGQTVAASFQTPTLFLVAKDLTKMQVDTNVSESDVGGVRNGETVNFTVDAYGDKTFKGNVAQVREAPITVQNVVTYDVVVGVPNPELLLMPGMTANVTIVTAQRDNVLRVPLQALSFSPHRRAFSPDEDHPSQHSARVWVQNGAHIRPVHIVRGLDDGTNVEIVSGDLDPGDQVVTGKVEPLDHPAAANGSSLSHGMHLHM
jgi:HlyD family secretion protein